MRIISEWFPRIVFQTTRDGRRPCVCWSSAQWRRARPMVALRRSQTELCTNICSRFVCAGCCRLQAEWRNRANRAPQHNSIYIPDPINPNQILIHQPSFASAFSISGCPLPCHTPPPIPTPLFTQQHLLHLPLPPLFTARFPPPPPNQRASQLPASCTVRPHPTPNSIWTSANPPTHSPYHSLFLL